MARLFIVLAFIASASAAPAVEAVGCAKGTYYWGAWLGTQYCVKCPTGMESQGCTKCMPDPYHKSCTPKPTLQTPEKKCAPGKYHDVNAKTGCTDCARGQFNDAWDSKCVKCVAGRFMPNTGALACYKCNNGRYAAERGASLCARCKSCARGHAITTNGEGAASATKCSCTACTPGRYTAPGYTRCFDCAEGRFQARNAETTCDACKLGTYQPNKLGRTCFSCPKGKTTTVLGAKSLSTCTVPLAKGKLACAAGTNIFYSNDNKALYCLNCARGRYGEVVENFKYGGVCKDCAADEYQPFEGRTSCHKCPLGSTKNMLGTACVRKPATKAVGSPVQPLKIVTIPKPSPCKLGSWGQWGMCNAKCGTGEQTRTRSVTPTSTRQIYPAPLCVERSSESRRCHAGVHCKTDKIDCEVGNWQRATSCSASCNADPTSTQSWTRKITRQPKNGGKACPATTLVKGCNPFPCPVHCLVGFWGNWHPCEAKCGSGRQMRERAILRKADHGGSVCPSLSDWQPCNAKKPCPVDCVQASWSSWGVCSKQCGTGVQLRTRKLETAPRHGGKRCGIDQQMRNCMERPCKNDCVMGAWTLFSKCSVSCGSGTMYRTRKILKAPTGGEGCGPQKQTLKCFKPCPVHCVMSDWSRWSACSRTCGTGYSKRSRVIVKTSAWGGKPCGAKEAVLECNTDACPVDCIMEPWGAWGACDKKCGQGLSLRVRSVQRAMAYNGKECPHVQDSKICFAKPCPVDCVYSNWSSWSACSVSCGKAGTKTRLKAIVTRSAHGGKKCDNKQLMETATCDSGNPCPIHCTVGSWGSWGRCSLSCYDDMYSGKTNAPTQVRRRKIVDKMQNGGAICPSLVEMRTCNEHKRCPKDCTVGTWSSWSPCSKECGTGFQNRHREFTAPEDGGRKCPHVVEDRKCHVKPCKVDCVMSQWTSFNGCTKTCGGGVEVRRRSINVEGAHGGKTCNNRPKTEERACHQHLCPVDCSMGQWGGFSACSAKCGGGFQYKTRPIIQGNAHGGAPCTPTRIDLTCNTQKCPVPCKMHPWSQWSKCDKKCGGGKQFITRSVDVYPENGAPECPREVRRSRPCNTKLCPVDCVLTQWGQWGDCSKTCGNGVRISRRVVKSLQAFGGAACASSRARTMQCNMGSCPRACTVTGWGTWSRCTRKNGANCGLGSRERTRNIVDRGHQSACPILKDVEPCGSNTPCPIDCKTSKWSSWELCSVSCGGGVQRRSRTVWIEPKFGGKSCGSTTAMRSCNLANCPVDEVVSSWSQWGPCSQKCGRGRQQRTRSTTVESEFGGVDLPNFEGRLCNTQPCKVDCTFGLWGKWSACSKSCGTGIQRRFRGVKTAALNGGHCDDKQREETRSCVAVQLCPVDCKMGPWSPMTACSKSCGLGIEQRHRVVLRKEAHGGKKCQSNLVARTGSVSTNKWVVEYPKCLSTIDAHCNANKLNCKKRNIYELAQKYVERTGNCPSVRLSSFFDISSTTTLVELYRRTCDAGPCPVHCRVSQWSTFGACSKAKCGGGTKIRTRKVLQHATHGGEQCPYLADIQRCNIEPCAVDCKMGAWGNFGPCTSDCGGGKKIRSRFIMVKAAHGGKACGSTTHQDDCNTHICPVDCQLSNWGQWAPITGCTKTCGGGTKTRFKSIKAQARGAGKACALMITKETRPCNRHACDVDCVMTQWSTYTACSASCGTGTKMRWRANQVPAVNNGKACGPKLEEAKCNTQHCPIDCVPHPWYQSPWSACSVTCGWGRRTQVRTEAVSPKYGGKSCAAQGERMQVSQRCHLKNCPVHCKFSSWSSWNDCSMTCGNGFKSRTRHIEVQGLFGGKTCTGHKLKETIPCSLGICPVNCQVSTWGKWSACTRSGRPITCGNGTRKRNRKVITHGTTITHGIGKVCPILTDAESCTAGNCPIDCRQSAWSSWSSCSAICAGGTRERTRQILQYASDGGKKCGATSETQKCNTHVCAVDCVYSRWGSWTPCNKNCGGGYSFSHRSIDQDSQGNGKKCDGNSLKRAVRCNEEQCYSNEQKCKQIFDSNKAFAISKGRGCFSFLKAQLVKGSNTQGSSTGSCLWTFYTPMDVRQACPAVKLTVEDVKKEYPYCEAMILSVCNMLTSEINCHTQDGAELAQGKVWNDNKDDPTRGCPSPGSFKMTLHSSFKKSVAAHVDINLASAKQLDLLYGVGPSTADKIVAYRRMHGHFSDVQALRSVSGISDASVRRMFENAGPKYAKPVVRSPNTASANLCKYGERRTINWWAAKNSVSNVVGNERIRLGSATTGQIAGRVDLGSNGPWLVEFDAVGAGTSGRSITDEAVLRLDGQVRTVHNELHPQTQKITVDGSNFEFMFGFRSVNTDTMKHLGIHTATATCMAEPVDCIMQEWGAWGACSRACSHENGDGGGLQYRSRRVKTSALYGGKCVHAKMQKRKCNDHKCPWSMAVEAEDGALSGCAEFDNEKYQTTQTKHGNYKGSGYVAMDAGGKCRTGTSKITWNVRVPANGRYRLQYRYAVSGVSHVGSTIANSQLVVDYKYQETISFPGKPGRGYGDWLLTSADAELFKGDNTVVLETPPHASNGSKPHVDRLVITQLKKLERCTPGQVVALKWSTSASKAELVGNTPRGVRLGSSFNGKISGFADLGALGPWSIQFKVNTIPARQGDTVRAFFNRENKANIHTTNGIHQVAVPVTNSHPSFRFEFDAMSRDPNSHMEVYDGVAVCQGCSDVKCKAIPHQGKFKIQVIHPQPKRAGLGVAGTGELHGNHHTCGWSKLLNSCQCKCDKVQHTVKRQVTCRKAKNQYRATSRYIDAAHNHKYVERCVTCPQGKFVAQDNAEKCLWKPVNVYV